MQGRGNATKEWLKDIPVQRRARKAKKMGLVQAPIQPLSEADWQSAKSKCNDRGDFAQPCPICKDPFGLSEQVILSCTHIFHKVCLQSFERFSGKKVCPLCRKEQYQARVIFEGTKQCRQQSAIRIQATWRGFRVRSWYKELRKQVPPNDPKLRQKFFQDKLSEITNKVLESSEKFHRKLDFFFEELNENLKYSQSVMRQLDSENSERDWGAIQLKAVERGEVDCSICMMPLSVEQRTTDEEITKKGCFLLSCSHVFHSQCVESFEQFSLTKKYLCPICRSPYEKKEYILSFNL